MLEVEVGVATVHDSDKGVVQVDRGARVVAVLILAPVPPRSHLLFRDGS